MNTPVPALYQEPTLVSTASKTVAFPSGTSTALEIVAEKAIDWPLIFEETKVKIHEWKSYFTIYGFSLSTLDTVFSLWTNFWFFGLLRAGDLIVSLLQMAHNGWILPGSMYSANVSDAADLSSSGGLPFYKSCFYLLLLPGWCFWSRNTAFWRNSDSVQKSHFFGINFQFHCSATGLFFILHVYPRSRV